MPEYIDRKAFIKRLENEADRSSDIINLLILNGIANIVRDENIAPAADVVEVVRCKDCAHYGGITFGKICRRWSAFNTKNCTKPDDFCSYGIKKDW